MSVEWDPLRAPADSTAPWLPRVMRAMTSAATESVPVSLAVEVIDRAGHVHSEIGDLPLPSACDEPAAGRSRSGRVVYLDPLAPPAAPGTRGKVQVRGWPPVYAPDPLDGAIVWRDRSDDEDGFRIYARRSWFEADCSVTDGPWTLVTTVPKDQQRYRPRHNQVVHSIPVPDIKHVPGYMTAWEYAVASYNEAGTSGLVLVGSFLGGSEAFCDTGLLEPSP